MNKPKEREMGAGEFKAHCLQLIDEVNHSRVPIIVTKHGKPLAKLVPYLEEPVSLFGCMKDSVVIHGNIVDGTGEIWEADAD
jgi:prevent-host-death family protein